MCKQYKLGDEVLVSDFNQASCDMPKYFLADLGPDQKYRWLVTGTPPTENSMAFGWLEETAAYEYIKPAEEVEELTMEEICQRLGRTIKIKK